MVGVLRDVIDLCFRESHPLTEGNVQGDSVLTAVELRGPKIRQLP
jgi:hypothetical protein